MATTVGPKGQPQVSSASDFTPAADITAVADFAAAVGNRRVGTSAQRTALAGADLSSGLEFYETDTAKTYIYAGAAWVQTPVRGAVVTSGVFTPATGWTLTGGSAAFQRQGRLVQCYVNIIRSGSTVTVPDADGNIANVVVGTVATAWRPVFAGVAGSGSGGRIASFTINTAGTVQLNAVSPTASINTNDELSFGGMYFLAD